MSIFRQQFSVAESCMHGSLFMQLFLSMTISWGHITQGRVATCLRCGGILTITSVANLSLSLTVKEFWKSVKIWQSYHHEFGGPFFLEHSVYIYIYIYILVCCCYRCLEQHLQVRSCCTSSAVRVPCWLVRQSLHCRLLAFCILVTSVRCSHHGSLWADVFWHNTHTQPFYHPFPGLPGWAGGEEIFFWTLWRKGR